MSDDTKVRTENSAPDAGGDANGQAMRDNQEHELEAEQESAQAMDADVPQPGEDGTLSVETGQES